MCDTRISTETMSFAKRRFPMRHCWEGVLFPKMNIWCIWMRPAAPTSRPQQITEQMLRQVRQAVSWTYPLDVLTIVWLHLPYDAMGDIDAFYENTANQTAGNSCPLIL